MLQAQLRGKLRYEQENLEDLLTSSVFGTLSYLSADALISFLMQAEGPDAEGLRECLREPTIVRAEYQFWPKIRAAGCNACEPDVALARDNLALLASGVPAFLVYVTPEYVMPHKEIDDSRAAARETPARIVWLSWRALSSSLLSDSPMARDLLAVMKHRYALAYFDGVEVPRQQLTWTWTGPVLMAPTSWSWTSARTVALCRCRGAVERTS